MEPSCVIEEITDVDKVPCASLGAQQGRDWRDGATGSSGSSGALDAEPAAPAPRGRQEAPQEQQLHGPEQQRFSSDGGQLHERQTEQQQEAGGEPGQEHEADQQKAQEQQQQQQQQQQEQGEEKHEGQQQHVAEPAPWAPANEAERQLLAAAEALKAAGNDLYSNNQFEEALGKYQEVGFARSRA
jgi:hypothetical protein